MIFALLVFSADLKVHIDARALPLLRVRVDLAKPADRLCTSIVGGGRGIKGLTALADDPDCFAPKASYVVDLKALDRDNPDFAASIGSAWIFNDQAVILRPEPLPEAFNVEVTVEGNVQTVWPKQGATYVADRDAFDGGSYWGLGDWQRLPNVRIAGRDVGIVRAPATTSKTMLSAWVERALNAVASFHGMLPAERMLVFLAPVHQATSAGVFGSILRRHWATAELLYGADAPPEDFAGDWMAVHELFHSVMPHVRTRPAWFIEGFTTYYQDVLRARAGMQSVQAMWDDLHDGVVRYCQPVAGRSLDEESRELRQRHAYQRVYWGGACVALALDVAIRARTGNAQSLDTVLKQLWKDSMLAPIDPELLVARLDAAAGAPITKAMLAEKEHTDFDALYASIGLRVRTREQVEILSSAPLKHVRDKIMTNAQR